MNLSPSFIRLNRAKTLLMLLMVIGLFAGCKRKEVELATINAAAYIDGNKATANFVLLTTSQTAVISDEGAIDRYMATTPMYLQNGVMEYSQKVIPGEYILVIQVKDVSAPVLYKTYTYNYITTNGTSTQSKYIMQFASGKALTFQPWVEKK